MIDKIAELTIATVIGGLITLLYAKRKFVFERLYEKRFDCSATAYGKLQRVQRFLASVLAPIVGGEANERKKREELFDATYDEFLGYFLDNELFISEHIVKEIDVINDSIREIIADYKTSKMVSDKSTDKFFGTALKAVKQLETPLLALKKSIREDLKQKS